MRRRVLHGDPVWFELEVRLAANVCAIVLRRQERLFRVFEMRVENLLGECEWLRGEYPAHFMQLLEEFGIWWCPGRDI